MADLVAAGKGCALGLKSVLTPSTSGAILEMGSDGSLNVLTSAVEMGQGEEEQAEGELTMTVPAGARPGEYYVSVYLNDQANNRLILNHEDPEPYRVLTLINDHADLQSPTVNRLTVTPDAVETSDLGSTLRVVRQCKATATKAELGKLDIEVKLEQDSCSAVQQICTQGNKALAAHAHERDRYRAEADAYSQQALKLKDRIEELAYQVNGLAAGTL